jgi:predicted esterase
MVSASGLLLVALGTLTSASPLMPRVDCQTGVYIISARGTGDNTYYVDGTLTFEGRTGQVANMIEARISGSRSVAVDYQASINYNASVVEGVNDAKKKIIEYVDTCGKNSRIVLLGFSQGGNVMSNVLAGGVNISQSALPDKYKPNSKSASTPFTSETEQDLM